MTKQETPENSKMEDNKMNFRKIFVQYNCNDYWSLQEQ